MTTAHIKAYIWQNKSSWYTFDKDGNYVLTKEAPPEAVESFKLWVSLFRE